MLFSNLLVGLCVAFALVGDESLSPAGGTHIALFLGYVCLPGGNGPGSHDRTSGVPRHDQLCIFNFNREPGALIFLISLKEQRTHVPCMYAIIHHKQRFI